MISNKKLFAYKVDARLRYYDELTGVWVGAYGNEVIYLENIDLPKLNGPKGVMKRAPELDIRMPDDKSQDNLSKES